MSGNGNISGVNEIRVKNKTPAAIQITSNQLVREALHQIRKTDSYVAPRQKVTNMEELNEYRMSQRKRFEDALRRNQSSVPAWLKYAEWEASQKDLERARSIYERALRDATRSRNVTFWVKYAEMEMKNRNVNSARNVLDRAVTYLPRVSQLWYKYVLMEEMLREYGKARAVFDRWMEWSPAPNAWKAYADFEMRQGEVERARGVYERFVRCHQTVGAWLKYASFEARETGDAAAARSVYSRAVDALGQEACLDDRLFLAFARFEERCGEDERARAIYKFALDKVPKAQAEELYQDFIRFEKAHGSRAAIEDAVVSRRRFQYEDQLAREGTSTAAAGGGGGVVVHNYDIWFDYIRLEEENGTLDQIREVYERAVACVPPLPEKRYWRRYVYLWLKYAVFEELVAEDPARAHEVYAAALRVIPPKLSFAKIWINYAELELRRHNIDEARRIFGNALGSSPAGSTCKDKIYRRYIAVEFRLHEVDRCRTLYKGYVANNPASCAAYIAFADMERALHETERARAILDIAVQQPVLDTPELLWMHYIDMECALGELDRARALYSALLQRTKHLKVWVSYAKFEHTDAHNDANARRIFEEAEAYFKAEQLRDERALLLETWLDFEKDVAGGDGDSDGGVPPRVAEVQARLPRKVKKQRTIKAEDGSDAGIEEYWEYVFPDEGSFAPNSKFLERARSWKKKKIEAADK